MALFGLAVERWVTSSRQDLATCIGEAFDQLKQITGPQPAVVLRRRSAS